MSTAPTPHPQQARRAAAVVHPPMRERGIVCMRHDLDAALVELMPAQLRQVFQAATELAKGADTREAMELLAALRAVSAHAARAALAAAGVIYRADVLLAVASAPQTGRTLLRELARLRRADLPQPDRDEAAAQLRAMCGPLDSSDLLHERAAPQAADPQAHAPEATDPEAAEPRAAAPERAAQEGNPPPSAAPGQQPSAGAPQRRAEGADESAPERAAPDARPAKRPRQQVKVYGRTGALTWESAPVRAARDEAAQSTVMIEGAAAAGDGTFDWRGKIIFACAQRELPQLLAVLLGWHDAAAFRFHGGKAGKELSLMHQEHGLYVKLREERETVAVPVTDADRYALAMLVLGVMADNDPGRDRHSVLAVCRDVMAPAARPRGSVVESPVES